ncbi:MAG: bifunctional (p)ppGpp synthetase/guanosine-3',5'-bis(diphosphate) 3'-pyrophosphohydrolase [Firmicutes bacterium]|jgi:guanosine-3',5'-bis(diphosphate) 3'-pyrophosphohydrolase|nr:bifunctional (p)ppGpp synthetase/guanosine-3',5'-bis(diphosphate) 3'-pyrophosphohydrolase [Bacillota bacterium]
MSIEELKNRIRQYSPHADLEIVERAYAMAQEAHRNQYRDSGDVYFRHPYEVAMILAEFEYDPVTIAAGLLHDVLEDTDVTREEMAEEFGEEIVLLVDGVTKLSRIPFQSHEEQQAHSLRKMFLAMAEDLRVIVIKLADRLHNMRTLRHLPEDRQKRISRETVEIYAPLAHRLGMWGIKWEMEDLAFRYLEPQAYYELVNLVAKKRQEREGELQTVMQTLRDRLVELGIGGEVSGRPKHLYSIYQKMQRQNKSFDEIYDLLAVRVIVDSVKDCYGVLGVIHTLWKPIPGRFKDYIAMPKSNMYQSLHTTVIGPKGDPFEIQIRTWEMHRIAEKGIAAHWLYKEGQQRGAMEFEEKIAWLRQVMDWLKEMKDPEEFMATLRIDLFEDEVFVFTPKGDVKNLPAGSTPVDFAFSVHTDVGLKCVGAKVNGRIVPLDYQLNNGEFVEILTSKTPSPSQDWLGFVKTSKARSKIRAWFREQQREEIVERGLELLQRECRKLGFDAGELLRTDALNDLAKRYGLASREDLLGAVGYGKILARQVTTKLAEQEGIAEPAPKFVPPANSRTARRDRAPLGISVKGMDNLLVRISKCCSPVPGDEIVGYITRGRGVSVHRVDCPNVAALANEPERRIDVQWNTHEDSSYPVELAIEAVDRTSLLASIMNAIAETKTYIESVNARTTDHRTALINLVVTIHDVDHMHDIMRRLRRVDGVVEVQRARPT